MGTKILRYKVENKGDWIAIPVHKSQMLWLHKNDDYALVHFTYIGESKQTHRLTALYEYRFFDSKTQKEITGKDDVFEIQFQPGDTKVPAGKTKIKFGSVDIMWSMMTKDRCYIYVIPDKFDMRILPGTEFEKYHYHPSVQYANNGFSKLQYKVTKKDEYIAIPIHESQMLWLHKGNDYGIVRFNYIGKWDKSSNSDKTSYKYRFFDGKTQKEATGDGYLYGQSCGITKTPPLNETNIEFGSFKIMWSTITIGLCYIYVIPDEFDMRILPATEFEKYPYYPVPETK